MRSSLLYEVRDQLLDRRRSPSQSDNRGLESLILSAGHRLRVLRGSILEVPQHPRIDRCEIGEAASQEWDIIA